LTATEHPNSGAINLFIHGSNIPCKRYKFLFLAEEMMQEITIHDKVFEPYITEEQINTRIDVLAHELDTSYRDASPVLISVLNGSFIFAADLFRKMTVPAEITFVKVSSYSGTQTTGNVKELIGLDYRIEGRDVIIIEDIVDTGITIHALLSQIKNRQPKSIKVCTLLNKPSRREIDVPVHYAGFEIPDRFVVGYGLDLDGLGRNLPHIYQLKTEHHA
jgi:hypoxanthine phosphoribosyltransferase